MSPSHHRDSVRNFGSRSRTSTGHTIRDWLVCSRDFASIPKSSQTLSDSRTATGCRPRRQVGPGGRTVPDHDEIADVAVVRGVSSSITRCELNYLDRAVAQHAAYTALLRRLGLEVVEIPADPTFPDCCFCSARRDLRRPNIGSLVLCTIESETMMWHHASCNRRIRFDSANRIASCSSPSFGRGRGERTTLVGPG